MFIRDDIVPQRVSVILAFLYILVIDYAPFSHRQPTIAPAIRLFVWSIQANIGKNWNTPRPHINYFRY
jgi:hypothetical protein